VNWHRRCAGCWIEDRRQKTEDRGQRTTVTISNKKFLQGEKRWKVRRWEDRKVGKMDFKTIYNCPKGSFVLPFYPSTLLPFYPSSLQPFLLYPLAAGGKSGGGFGPPGENLYFHIFIQLATLVGNHVNGSYT
jgi:hypothetical protein